MKFIYAVYYHEVRTQEAAGEHRTWRKETWVFFSAPCDGAGYWFFVSLGFHICEVEGPACLTG